MLALRRRSKLRDALRDPPRERSRLLPFDRYEPTSEVVVTEAEERRVAVVEVDDRSPILEECLDSVVTLPDDLPAQTLEGLRGGGAKRGPIRLANVVSDSGELRSEQQDDGRSPILPATSVLDMGVVSPEYLEGGTHVVLSGDLDTLDLRAVDAGAVRRVSDAPAQTGADVAEELPKQGDRKSGSTGRRHEPYGSTHRMSQSQYGSRSASPSLALDARRASPRVRLNDALAHPGLTIWRPELRPWREDSGVSLQGDSRLIHAVESLNPPTRS